VKIGCKHYGFEDFGCPGDSPEMVSGLLPVPFIQFGDRHD
jgi:hypothetical protein